MDSFCEQIVQKKKGAKEWAIIILVVLGALLLIFGAFLINLLIVALLAVGYGAWWLITTRNVEYEYCVTNGDIDVDKIVARRKRTRLVSVSGRKIRALAPYDPAKPLGKFQRTVLVAPSLDMEGLWYFTYHSKKNGNTLVVFQPNERVLRQLYAGLPKLVQMDTDRAVRDMDIDLSARHNEE